MISVSGRVASSTSIGAPLGSLSAWARLIEAGRELSRELPNASGETCSINAPALTTAECKRALRAWPHPVPWVCGTRPLSHAASSDVCVLGLRKDAPPCAVPWQARDYTGSSSSEVDDLSQLAGGWQQLSLTASTAASRTTTSAHGRVGDAASAVAGSTVSTAGVVASGGSLGSGSGSGSAAGNLHFPVAVSAEVLVDETCTLLDRQNAAAGAARNAELAEPHHAAAIADIITGAAAYYRGAAPPSDLSRSLVAAATSVAETAPWPAAVRILQGLTQMGNVGTRYFERMLERIRGIPLPRPGVKQVSNGGDSRTDRGMWANVHRGTVNGRGRAGVYAGGLLHGDDPGPCALEAVSMLQSLCAIYRNTDKGRRFLPVAMQRLMLYLQLPLLETLPGPAAVLPLLQALTSCGWNHDGDPSLLLRIGTYLSSIDFPAAVRAAARTDDVAAGSAGAPHAAGGAAPRAGGPPWAASAACAEDAEDALMRGPRLMALTPAQLVNVLDQFRVAEVHHIDLMERALDAVDRCLPAFTPSQATRVAECCARFMHHRPALMRRLGLHVGAQLMAGTVAPADVAGMVAATARCRVSDPRFMEAVSVYGEEHATAWLNRASLGCDDLAAGYLRSVKGRSLAGTVEGGHGAGMEALSAGAETQESHDLGSVGTVPMDTDAAAASKTVSGDGAQGNGAQVVEQAVNVQSGGGFLQELLQQCGLEAAGDARGGSQPAATCEPIQGDGRGARNVVQEEVSEVPQQLQATASDGALDLEALLAPPPAAPEPSKAMPAAATHIRSEESSAECSPSQQTPSPAEAAGSADAVDPLPPSELDEISVSEAPQVTAELEHHGLATTIRLDAIAAGKDARTALYLPRVPRNLEPYKLLDALSAVPGAVLEMFYMPYKYDAVASGTPGEGCAFVSVANPESVAAIWQRLQAGPLPGLKRKLSVEYALAPDTNALLHTLYNLRSSHKAYVYRSSSTRAQPLLLYVSGRLRGQVQPLEPRDVVTLEWARAEFPPAAPPPTAGVGQLADGTGAAQEAEQLMPQRRSHEDATAGSPGVMDANQPRQPGPLAAANAVGSADQAVETADEHSLGALSRLCLGPGDAGGDIVGSGFPCPIGGAQTSSVAPESVTPALAQSRSIAPINTGHPSSSEPECVATAAAAATPQAEVQAATPQATPAPAASSAARLPLLTPGQMALMAHSMAAVSFHHPGFLDALARLMRALVVRPVQRDPDLAAAVLGQPVEEVWAFARARALHGAATLGGDAEGSLPLPSIKSVLHAMHAITSRPDPDTDAFQELASVCASCLSIWMPGEAAPLATGHAGAHMSAARDARNQSCLEPDGRGLAPAATSTSVGLPPGGFVGAAEAATPVARPVEANRLSSAPAAPASLIGPAGRAPLAAVPLPDARVFDVYVKLLAQSLTAAADHGARLHSPALCSAAAALLSRHLPRMRPRAALALLQPLVRFDTASSRQLVRAVAPLLAQQPERLSAPSLVCLAWACAKTGFRDDRAVVRALAARTVQVLNELPTAGAAQLFWALSVLRTARQRSIDGDHRASTHSGQGPAAPRTAAGRAGADASEEDALYKAYEGLMHTLLERHDISARDLLLLQEGLRMSGAGSVDGASGSAAMEAFLHELLTRTGQRREVGALAAALAVAAPSLEPGNEGRAAAPEGSLERRRLFDEEPAVPTGGMAPAIGQLAPWAPGQDFQEGELQAPNCVDPAYGTDSKPQHLACASCRQGGTRDHAADRNLVAQRQTAARSSTQAGPRSTGPPSASSSGQLGSPDAERAYSGGVIGQQGNAGRVVEGPNGGQGPSSGEDYVAVMVRGLLGQIMAAQQGMVLEESGGVVVRLQVPVNLDARTRLMAWA